MNPTGRAVFFRYYFFILKHVKIVTEQKIAYNRLRHVYNIDVQQTATGILRCIVTKIFYISMSIDKVHTHFSTNNKTTNIYYTNRSSFTNNTNLSKRYLHFVYSNLFKLNAK